MLTPSEELELSSPILRGATVSILDGVVPHVQNMGWFFDTELLLLSLRAGYKIKEIPVHWVDDPDTRVRVVSTV